MDRLSNIMKTLFNSKLVYEEKYLKAKVKCYKCKTNTDFYDRKIPKEDYCCECLSAIVIDLVYKRNTDYYPRFFLEECK